ncbi:DUF4214 domain-containing protein [Paenibacillus hamazuiensis]|uniref:DUF4214 domain-containing protein n=1 Tax=Paenibacillus hamazuiensis TaxID=2936508 RepID=UPI00200C9B49|nr:DUF4214 domain-containing protein [Paenibacillus hamazuiensis]
MQIMHKMHQKNGADFVTELFRQLLDREPDEGGLNYYMYLLQSGMSKHQMMIDIMQSHEAFLLYHRPAGPVTDPFHTAARKLRYVLTLPPEEFVEAMFAELLCRKPDFSGCGSFLQLLRQGITPFQAWMEVMRSEEFSMLLGTNRTNFARVVIQHYLSLVR